MISRSGFITDLRIYGHAPHYAYPYAEPEEALDYFKLGAVQAMREVLDGSLPSKQLCRWDIATQRAFYKALIRNTTEIPPFTIAVASYPGDSLACNFAATIQYAIMRNFDLSFTQWKWVTPSMDIKKTQEEDDYFERGYPAVMVIRNVIPERQNLYEIRNILEAYPRTLRLVVVAGANPFDYFDNYLHFTLSGAFNIIGTYQHLPDEVKVKTQNKEDWQISFAVADDVRALIESVQED